jgi:hypothetical protein
MNRLYIIIIVILCFTSAPVAITNDIIKHYDEHHKITGYTVIDGDRQTHYDRSWNRIGHTDWDNDDTGGHYDKDHNRTGYSKAYKNKEVMFDKSWNRKGYKK